MNKVLTLWLLLIVGFSCNFSNEAQKPNKYTVNFTELDEAVVYHDGEEVNIVKIKSKYFETYIPETWKVTIRSDSVFVAIDTLDKLKDNISITYSKFYGCTVEKIRKSREQTLISNGIVVLSRNSDKLMATEDEVLVHDLEIEVKSQQLRQRCYYLCQEDKSIMCCLTSTKASFEKKEIILDMVSNFLMNSILNWCGCYLFVCL